VDFLLPILTYYGLLWHTFCSWTPIEIKIIFPRVFLS